MHIVPLMERDENILRKRYQLVTKPKIGDIMNKLLEKPIPQIEWERDVLRLRLNDYVAKRDALEKIIERDQQKLKELEVNIGAHIIYLNPNIYNK